MKTLKEKRKIAIRAVELFEKEYPDAICSLEWGGEPWRLLVMGRLSAQCTDAKVNIVCRELFSVFPTANALAEGKDYLNIRSARVDSIRACVMNKIDLFGSAGKA